MRKPILLLLLLLLAGCLTLPWEAQKDELEFVPRAANALIIFRPSSLLNDSDFNSLYNSSDEVQFEVKRVEATTGINPAKLERIVLFFTFDSLKQESEAYGGFIARGEIEKEKVLNSMKLNNIIKETTYNNQVIYEVSSKEAPENKTYFSFLQNNILIGGSRNAVQDAVDVSNGKGESVKARSALKRAYEKLDSKAVFLLLFENTPQIKEELKTSGGMPSPAPLSGMDSLGFSISKKERNLDFTTILIAQDASSANNISNLIERSISFLKGLSPQDSALEKITKKIRIETRNDEVWVTLSSTLDEIEKLSKEIEELSSE